MRLLLAYSLNSLNRSHGVSGNCKNKKYKQVCLGRKTLWVTVALIACVVLVTSIKVPLSGRRVLFARLGVFL